MPYDDDYGGTLTGDTGAEWQPTTGDAAPVPQQSPDGDLSSGAQIAMSIIQSWNTPSAAQESNALASTIGGESGVGMTPAEAAKANMGPDAAAKPAAADNPWSVDGIMKMVNNLGSFVNKNPMAAIALGGAAKALLDKQDKKQLAQHYERADATQAELAALATKKQDNAATSGTNLKVNAGSSTPQLGIIGGYLERRKRNLTAGAGG